MGELYKARDSNIRKNLQIQAYLGKTGFGSRPPQQSERCNDASRYLYAGGGSWLRYLKKENVHQAQ